MEREKLYFTLKLLGVFAGMLLVLTVVGLVALPGEETSWKEILTHKRLRGARSVPMRRLQAWRGAEGEPPRTVKALDGEAVELTGYARPDPECGGLWVVAEHRAASRASRALIKPARALQLEGAVWIALSEGELEKIKPYARRLLRVEGVLEVGRRRLPCGREAAYSLKLGRIWRWERRAAPGEDHEDHKHDEHRH